MCTRSSSCYLRISPSSSHFWLNRRSRLLAFPVSYFLSFSSILVIWSYCIAIGDESVGSDSARRVSCVIWAIYSILTILTRRNSRKTLGSGKRHDCHRHDYKFITMMITTGAGSDVIATVYYILLRWLWYGCIFYCHIRWTLLGIICLWIVHNIK